MRIAFYMCGLLSVSPLIVHARDNLESERYSRGTSLLSKAAYGLTDSASDVIDEIHNDGDLPLNFLSLVEKKVVDIGGGKRWADISASFKFLEPMPLIRQNTTDADEGLFAISKVALRPSYEDGTYGDPVCYAVWWLPWTRGFRYTAIIIKSDEMEPLEAELRKQNAYPQVLTLDYGPTPDFSTNKKYHLTPTGGGADKKGAIVDLHPASNTASRIFTLIVIVGLIIFVRKYFKSKKTS